LALLTNLTKEIPYYLSLCPEEIYPSASLLDNNNKIQEVEGSNLSIKATIKPTPLMKYLLFIPN